MLTKERKGEYLWETVQVIPHVTNEIKTFIYSVGKKDKRGRGDYRDRRNDGRYRKPAVFGGDPPGKLRGRKDNCLFIHVTLVPYIKKLGRAQIEAYTAFGQGIAVLWYHARYHCDAQR